MLLKLHFFYPISPIVPIPLKLLTSFFLKVKEERKGSGVETSKPQLVWKGSLTCDESRSLCQLLGG